MLDSVEAARAIADSLYHQATPYDPIIRWAESVRFIASTRMAHRSFVVTDVRRPAIAELPVGNVFAYALGTQARPLAVRRLGHPHRAAADLPLDGRVDRGGA